MKHINKVTILLLSILIAINLGVYIFVVDYKKNNKYTNIEETYEQANETIYDSDIKINDEEVTYNQEEDDLEVRTTLSEGFYYEPLSENIKKYITGKSYKENDIIDYDDLRYVVVKYINFNNEECEGELIVNVKVADDVLNIFKELYDASYQIEKINLIDKYDANDDESMQNNNTSAFNFRMIDGQETISDHSYGIAIDINPLYNPYVRSGFGNRNVLPVNGTAYADRSNEFEHKIVKGDLCYNTFAKYGWKWGGEWESPTDYQHFYKEIEK